VARLVALGFVMFGAACLLMSRQEAPTATA
jgi:hypothetical protein